MSRPQRFVLGLTLVCALAGSAGVGAAGERLFSADRPYREWVSLDAAGFSVPVTGVIYSGDKKPECGVPMGGIGTGFMDVEADGTLGYCTVFKPVWGANCGGDGGRHWRDVVRDAQGAPQQLNDPSRGPMSTPFMAITTGGKKYLLTTTLGDAEFAKPTKIDYWGHYPIADMEFRLDGPVGVGLRAWSPFIPGDIERSSVPGAVLEVHLRNSSDAPQQGTLFISFPGPRERESEGPSFAREMMDGPGLTGVSVVTAKRLGYVLAAIDLPGARVDAKSLTGKDSRAASSIAVDFDLNGGTEKVLRFVLAWYAPTWESSWAPAHERRFNKFTRMYATRFARAPDVAGYIARNHQSLLKSILAWQQVIYSEKSLPGWLQDSLINVLQVMPEVSYWAAAGPPIGSWCKPEDGLFSLLESHDADGQQSCIPCDTFGNLPVVYFFPRLAKSTLRAYTHHMNKEGCPPMTLGKGLDLTGPYQYQYQNTLNPCCYVDLVDRLWLRTGDEGALQEFYPAVKKTTQYMARLIPGENPIISTAGPEWYESMSIGGMSSHVGGIRLAHMQMAGRMAEKAGDAQFAEQCRKWFKQGKKDLEDRLWAGTHYLLSLDPASGNKSDLILAYQLDGQWLSRLHGLPGVFRKDRLNKTLQTIKVRCGDSSVTDGGLLNIVRPDGRVVDFGGRMGMYCSMPGSVFEAAMTYLYEGDRQTGMRIARDSLNLLVNVAGMTWDMPNMVHAEPGKTRRIYGFDYYQVWSLWGLPAAMAGQDIKASCAPGSLVDRVIRAGAEQAAHYQEREKP